MSLCIVVGIVVGNLRAAAFEDDPPMSDDENDREMTTT